MNLNHWWYISKLSEKLNKRNLLKICLQFTYPTDFCIICISFYAMGKSENIWFKKKKQQQQENND